MKRLFWAAAAVALLAAPAWSQGQTAPGTTLPPAGAPAAAVVKAPEFVKAAAISDMFEIQSSQLALEKGKGAEVKRFAQHMIDDHKKASEKLKSVAADMPIPTQLDEKHAAMITQLKSLSGAEFDRVYLDMQKAAHWEAVLLFEQYSKSGDTPKLKQFAEQTLPTLKEHWSEVQKLATL